MHRWRCVVGDLSKESWIESVSQLSSPDWLKDRFRTEIQLNPFGENCRKWGGGSPNQRESLEINKNRCFSKVCFNKTIEIVDFLWFPKGNQWKSMFSEGLLWENNRNRWFPLVSYRKPLRIGVFSKVCYEKTMEIINFEGAGSEFSVFLHCLLTW